MRSFEAVVFFQVPTFRELKDVFNSTFLLKKYINLIVAKLANDLDRMSDIIASSLMTIFLYLGWKQDLWSLLCFLWPLNFLKFYMFFSQCLISVRNIHLIKITFKNDLDKGNNHKTNKTFVYLGLKRGQ